MLIKRVFLMPIFFAILLNAACAAENCTYNNDYFNKKQLENTGLVDLFKWYPKTKEAKGILINGNLFSVKYWSCNHYGKQAIMIIGPQIIEIPDLLNNQILQIGKVILNSFELELLSNALRGKKIKLPESSFMLRIEASDLAEFYVSINVINEIVVIEIKLYKV